MSSLVLLSRLPVGSSASRMLGLQIRARAMATRCFSPPESWFGRCLIRSPRPDALEHLRGAFAPRPPAVARVDQRHLHVPEGAGAAEQLEGLEHEADPLVADAGQGGVAHAGGVLAVQVVPAAGHPVQAAQHVHQRALAGAGGAHDRHVLVLAQLQRHAVQRVDALDAHLVHAHHVFKLDHDSVRLCVHRSRRWYLWSPFFLASSSALASRSSLMT